MGRRNVMVFGFVAALGAAVMAQAPPQADAGVDREVAG